jgi:hypothetical protein
MQSQLVVVFAFCVGVTAVGCAVAEPQQGQGPRPDLAVGIGGVGGDDLGDVVVPTGPTGPTDPRDLAMGPADVAMAPSPPPVGPDMAGGPDLATGTAPTGCSAAEHLVINEVKTGGTTSTLSDEFVEIYNPCASDVTVSGWSLGHFAATGTTETTIAKLATPMSIAGHGYLLIASTACGCKSLADQTYTTGAFAAGGGGVGLRDANGTLIDAMGYGDGTSNGFVEDKPAAAPAADGSVARHPNGVDTNHNQNDFAVTASPTPRAQNQ